MFIEMEGACAADAFTTNLSRFHVLCTAWHAFFKHILFLNSVILCRLNYCPCSSQFLSPLPFLKVEE